MKRVDELFRNLEGVFDFGTVSLFFHFSPPQMSMKAVCGMAVILMSAIFLSALCLSTVTLSSLFPPSASKKSIAIGAFHQAVFALHLIPEKEKNSIQKWMTLIEHLSSFVGTTMERSKSLAYRVKLRAYSLEIVQCVSKKMLQTMSHLKKNDDEYLNMQSQMIFLHENEKFMNYQTQIFTKIIGKKETFKVKMFNASIVQYYIDIENGIDLTAQEWIEYSYKTTMFLQKARYKHDKN